MGEKFCPRQGCYRLIQKTVNSEKRRETPLERWAALAWCFPDVTDSIEGSGPAQLWGFPSQLRQTKAEGWLAACVTRFENSEWEEIKRRKDLRKREAGREPHRWVESGNRQKTGKGVCLGPAPPPPPPPWTRLKCGLGIIGSERQRKIEYTRKLVQIYSACTLE